MTLWSLLRAAPAIIALWNRFGRTKANETVLWGSLLGEAAAIIARLYGLDVPIIADVAAVGGAGGALAHKHTVAEKRGFNEEWKSRALQPKD